MIALRRLGQAILIVMGILIAVGVVGFALLCVAVDRYGALDRAQPADVIVVLGARVLPNGDAGPDLLPRVEKAVHLYEQRYARFLICAGGPAGDAMSAAAIARREAINLGVPPSAVLIADGTSNTREDAARTAEVMGAHGWRQAIVVSHPLHLLRATYLFRRAGLVVLASPTTTDVGKISMRWRAFYAVREAALIAFDIFVPSGDLPDWALKLQQWLRVAGLDDVA